MRIFCRAPGGATLSALNVESSDTIQQLIKKLQDHTGYEFNNETSALSVSVIPYDENIYEQYSRTSTEGASKVRILGLISENSVSTGYDENENALEQSRDDSSREKSVKTMHPTIRRNASARQQRLHHIDQHKLVKPRSTVVKELHETKKQLVAERKSNADLERALEDHLEMMDTKEDVEVLSQELEMMRKKDDRIEALKQDLKLKIAEDARKDRKIKLLQFKVISLEEKLQKSKNPDKPLPEEPLELPQEGVQCLLPPPSDPDALPLSELLLDMPQEDLPSMLPPPSDPDLQLPPPCFNIKYSYKFIGPRQRHEYI